ncbi:MULTISPECIES: hypothetical protein [unclassified Methanoregula]|uniref:hypothetical protein n=1 Tax=unclassified Methanoregula TaxID=2649730 RepID=UPI0009D0132B|nr:MULTISPECIES: hypothetical protein [unclassified Methanoregula]OPX64160.1 MAG: hypothetical protein A4E33_01185 [Methanoregula sp. PtaB.Bin085]OPY34720.1 MAG: hypothetical protein A4E34_01248 [Methanoregula sp. PtaU1.Bin006]
MRRRKDPFEKPWVIIAAVVGVIAVIVVALIFFMGDSNPGQASPGQQSATPGSSGQSAVVGVAPSVIRTQVPVTVPTQGVFVRVNYIGGFAGEYGMEGNMTATRNSGDRFFEVENATGTVSATFHKEDSSRHEITVEIYRNGQSLQSAGNTSSYGEASVTAAV